MTASELFLFLSLLLIVIILFRIFILVTAIGGDRRRIATSYNDKISAYLSRTGRTKSPRRSLKTCAVLGSGGHTTEMIRLISNLNSSYYKPFCFIVANTDTTSIMRLQQLLPPTSPQQPWKIYRIPRAREVGQTYLSSILTTLYSLAYSLSLVFYHIKPDLLIINGPGTCLPIAILVFISRVFNFKSFPKIIFVESFCRVKTLSLTGLVLYKLGICDLFCVHWLELMDIYDPTRKGDLILLSSFIQQDPNSHS